MVDTAGQALAIALVFGLLAALAWLKRRRAAGFGPLPRRAKRRLEPVERVALGPHQALHIVRWDDRALLISTGSAGCCLLESRPWADPGGSESS